MNPEQHAQLAKLEKLRGILWQLRKLNREVLGSDEQAMYAPPVRSKPAKQSGNKSRYEVSDTITGLHNRKNPRMTTGGDTSGKGRQFTGAGGIGGNVGAYRT